MTRSGSRPRQRGSREAREAIARSLGLPEDAPWSLVWRPGTWYGPDYGEYVCEEFGLVIPEHEWAVLPHDRSPGWPYTVEFKRNGDVSRVIQIRRLRVFYTNLTGALPGYRSPTDHSVDPSSASGGAPGGSEEVDIAVRYIVERLTGLRDPDLEGDAATVNNLLTDQYLEGRWSPGLGWEVSLRGLEDGRANGWELLNGARGIFGALDRGGRPRGHRTSVDDIRRAIREARAETGLRRVTQEDVIDHLGPSGPDGMTWMAETTLRRILKDAGVTWDELLREEDATPS